MGTSIPTQAPDVLEIAPRTMSPFAPRAECSPGPRQERGEAALKAELELFHFLL